VKFIYILGLSVTWITKGSIQMDGVSIKQRQPLFFTLSDRNFLPRTLAMCESLRNYDKTSEFHFIALEELTEHETLQFSNIGVEVRVLSSILGPETLKMLQSTRSFMEFVWNLPSLILSRILEVGGSFSDVVYLDADVYFFSSPEQIWSEVEPGRASIVRHNFSDRLARIFLDSGEFNVSWVSIPNTPSGIKLSQDWSTKCLDLCPDKPTLHKGRIVYGDQKYLDYWQSDFGDLIHVIENLGAGVAPWNFEKYSFTSNPIRVDGHNVIFYHFSSHQFGFPLARKMGTEYSRVRSAPSIIYKPYETILKEKARQLAIVGWKSRYEPLPIRTKKYFYRLFERH